MTETPALLSLHSVCKSYGSLAANSKIDLAVNAGSIHAILGENGAGKSTLMKLIYGVEMPDEGEIRWQGKPVILKNPADAQRLGIGMVFQHFSLFETLNVVQNIALLVPGRTADLADQITALGAQFGLPIDPKAMVHSLSVGERQRVEIIRCLMLEPRLLILDEPTSVLPPQSVEKLFETLRLLQQKGIAILFISHKLAEIQDLCDRATILRAGRVTGRVDPRKHDGHELAQLMIGRDIPKVKAAKSADVREVRLTLNNLSAPRTTPFGTSLSQINLSVRGGEIIGIAGISGNGQQELAELISGERAALSDEDIHIMGEPVGHRGAAERRALGLSFIPEERLGRGAVPDMSLSDNAFLTGIQARLVQNGWLARKRERAFTARCIQEFDVRAQGPFVEAATLSGGNLQKLILAREISLNPAVMLISQPTWGVDIGAATAIRQRLVDMRARGVALMIISEDLEELFALSDALYVLAEGRLSGPFNPHQITASEIGGHMIGAKQAPSASKAAPSPQMARS